MWTQRWLCQQIDLLSGSVNLHIIMDKNPTSRGLWAQNVPSEYRRPEQGECLLVCRLYDRKRSQQKLATRKCTAFTTQSLMTNSQSPRVSDMGMLVPLYSARTRFTSLSTLGENFSAWPLALSSAQTTTTIRSTH